MSVFLGRFAIAFVIGLAPCLVSAQQSIERRNVVVGLLGLLGSTEDIKQSAMALFRQNDVDGRPGVSALDRTLLIARQAAKIRARSIAKWLELDLNGDLVVTADEMRVLAIPNAYKPFRSGRNSVWPLREQAELIIEREIEARLKNDLDGNGEIGFNEILDVAEAILEGTPNLDPRARMMPSVDMDQDGNGTVSDAEMAAVLDGIIASIDSDSDGKISPNERKLAKAALSQPPLGSAGAYLSRVLTKRRKCVMPQPEQDAVIAVIGGYEGSGLSDIHFGDTSDTVKVIDLAVPAKFKSVYLVVALRDSVVLRVTDPSGKLKQVIMTGGEVGLTGDGAITPQRVHSDCNLDVWMDVSSENPDPFIFYGERLGRSPDRLVTAYTLGAVNLGVGNNRPIVALSGVLDAPEGKAAAKAWARFELFNPGGLVSIEMDAVRSLRPVFKHEILPQFAGVAKLIQDGTLIRIDGGDARRQVTENGGEIRLGGNVYRPGGGDDAITFEGLRYTEERPGLWIGREEDVYIATATFTFPAGLSGAHAITVLVPEDIDLPIGDPGHSTIRRLKQSDLAPSVTP